MDPFNDPSGSTLLATEAIRQSAGAAAAEYSEASRRGEEPSTFASAWEDVAPQFRGRFPNLDEGEARRMFIASRYQSAAQGLLAATAREDPLRTGSERIPLGGVATAAFNSRDREALQRIRDGEGTHDDYANARRYIGHQEFQAQRTLTGVDRAISGAGDMLAQAPAFVAEFALPGGAARRTAAGLGRLAGPTARRLTGFAGDAVRFGAGEAVRGALMPGRAAASVSGAMMPDVARAGNTVVGPDKTGMDAFRGYLDHQIEVWSEASGGAASRLLGAIPGVARAQSMATGLMRSAVQRLGVEGAARRLEAIGYNGLLGEWLEERVGDAARGATGVRDDYGMFSDAAGAARGDPAARARLFEQLAIEGMSFPVMSLAFNGVGAAMNGLQRRGVTPAAAEQQIRDVIRRVVADPEAVKDAPAELREFAESVAEIHHAEPQGPRPGEEAMPQSEARFGPVQENQMPGFMRPQQGPPQVEQQTAQQDSTLSAEDSTADSTPAQPANVAVQPAPEAAPAPVQAPAPAQVAPDAPAGQPGAFLGTPIALLRERMAARGRGNVVGAVAKPSVIQAEKPSLAEIQRRVRAEQPVLMADVLDAAKLDAKDRYVIERLMADRTDIPTLEQIGADPALMKLGDRSEPYTRERVRQFAARAIEKIGGGNIASKLFSVDAILQTGEEDRIVDAAEKGETVEIGEISANPEEVAAKVRDRIYAIQTNLNEINDNYLKEVKKLIKKGVSPKKIAELNQRIEKEAKDAEERLIQSGGAGPRPRTRGKEAQKPAPLSSTAPASQAGQAAGTQAVQAQPEVRLNASPGPGQPGQFRPVTAEDLARVSQISPAHASLVKRMQATIMKANLPIAQKVSYLRSQLDITERMTPEYAEVVNAGHKDAIFYGSIKELGQSIAYDPAVAEALKQGQVIGGAFGVKTKLLRLDGATSTHSQSRLHGHESLHAAVDAAKRFGFNVDGFYAPWKAEIADGQIGDYATNDVEEGLAELMGLYLSGEMTSEQLWTNFPKSAAFLEGHGWVPLRPEGEASFEAPPDIFERLIRSDDHIADTLKLQVSKELEAARRHVSPTTKAPETTSAAELAFQLRQRADDRLAIAADITAAVNKERARKGLPALPPGSDLRTVLAGTDPQVRAWAEEMAGKGVFTLAKQPDGSRIQKTIGKPADWILEGLGYKPEDLQAQGTGWKDRLKRKFGIEVEQAPSRLDTALIALHSVNQVRRGQEMAEKYLTFITPEQEAVAARLLNTVSTEQLEAFEAYLNHEKINDPAFFASAEESLRRITQLYDLTLDALQSVGWYSAEDVARIKRDYPDYVSMARVLEADDLRNASGSEIKPGWEKKRHGSGRQIVSPITSLQSRYAETAFIMAKQLQNEALIEAVENLNGEYAKKVDLTPQVRLTDLAEKMTAIGISKAEQQKLIDVVGPELIEYLGMPKWTANGQNFYIYRENGQRKALEITSKPLYELFTNNQEPTAIVGGVTQAMLAVPGLKEVPKLTKWGATQANLVFPIRNMTRDVWTALQNGEGPVLERIGRMVMGHMTAFKAAGQNLAGQEISNVYARLYQQSTGQELREVAYTRAGKGALAFGKLQGATPGQQKAVQVFHKVQDVLEVIGAGEQGPRIGAFKKALQDLGYTEAKINAALKADPSASPVPLNVLLYARQKAAEATVDFSRQGIDTRQANKIIPFLSPQIAALSQESRNWNKAIDEFKRGEIGPWSKAMLGTLAAYLGYELLHWWSFKDEDWYKNQPAHLRYDWWNLHQDSDGRLWGVPKPKGIMAMVGAQFQEGLRAISDSESRPGMSAGFAAQQLTPEVLPIGIAQAFQLARNSDWRGAAIVPQRDLQEMNAWEQFRTHQLPYVLDQLSGGLASARIFRGPQEAFRSSRGEPTLPVNEYFERLTAATAAHNRAVRAQQPLAPEEQREYARLHAIERAMRNLSAEARRRPERMVEIRRRQNELARRALAP